MVAMGDIVANQNRNQTSWVFVQEIMEQLV